VRPRGEAYIASGYTLYRGEGVGLTRGRIEEKSLGRGRWFVRVEVFTLNVLEGGERDICGGGRLPGQTTAI